MSVWTEIPSTPTEYTVAAEAGPESFLALRDEQVTPASTREQYGWPSKISSTTGILEKDVVKTVLRSKLFEVPLCGQP